MACIRDVSCASYCPDAPASCRMLQRLLAGHACVEFKEQLRMYIHQELGFIRCYMGVRQTLRVSPGGSTFLHERSSWPPSWKCGQSKIRLSFVNNPACQISSNFQRQNLIGFLRRSPQQEEAQEQDEYRAVRSVPDLKTHHLDQTVTVIIIMIIIHPHHPSSSSSSYSHVVTSLLWRLLLLLMSFLSSLLIGCLVRDVMYHVLLPETTVVRHTVWCILVTYIFAWFSH